MNWIDIVLVHALRYRMMMTTRKKTREEEEKQRKKTFFFFSSSSSGIYRQHAVYMFWIWFTCVYVEVCVTLFLFESYVLFPHAYTYFVPPYTFAVYCCWLLARCRCIMLLFHLIHSFVWKRSTNDLTQRNDMCDDFGPNERFGFDGVREMLLANSNARFSQAHTHAHIWTKWRKRSRWKNGLLFLTVLFIGSEIWIHVRVCAYIYMHKCVRVYFRRL